jgi:hypothetical protein
VARAARPEEPPARSGAGRGRVGAVARPRARASARRAGLGGRASLGRRVRRRSPPRRVRARPPGAAGSGVASGAAPRPVARERLRRHRRRAGDGAAVAGRATASAGLLAAIARCRVGKSASSSWRRRPPTPARLGSIAASRRAAAARAVRPGGPSVAVPTIPAPERLDHLVEEAAQVATAILEPSSSCGPPAHRRHERVDEAVDRLGSARPRGRVPAPRRARRSTRTAAGRASTRHRACRRPPGGRSGGPPRASRFGRPHRGSGGACLRSRRSSAVGRRSAGGATGSRAGTPGGGSRRT